MSKSIFNKGEFRRAEEQNGSSKRHYAMQHYSLNNAQLFRCAKTERKLVDYLWEGTVTDKSEEGLTRKEYQIKGSSEWTLNAYDLQTWLGVLYLHRIRKLRTEGEKLEMELEGLALNKPQIRIQTTRYQLLELLGRSKGKKSYEALVKSMERLASVRLVFTITNEEKKRRIWSASFFNFFVDESESREGTPLMLSINPVFAETAMRQFSDKPTSLHCLEDYHGLDAKQSLLHHAWCNKIHPGTTKAFSLDSICRYIHGSTAVDRKLRSYAKSTALSLHERGGWVVLWQPDNQQFMVTRPREDWE